MVIDVNVPPKTITTIVPTFDAGTITWTAGNTSTILGNITNNEILLYPDWDLYRPFDTKEEPPKTYLQLPIGKRLISI